MTAEPAIPESREVMFHEYRVEITKIEKEQLARFREENINRWNRLASLDEFFTALKSHESIDNDWLSQWHETVLSALRGEPKENS